MAETFTWEPLVNPEGDIAFRAVVAEFGDGYTQLARDGLNTKRQTWPFVFAGPAAYITPIIAFLDAHQSDTTFLFTPPLGSEGYYRCLGYKLRDTGVGRYYLSTTFRQEFQP